MIRRFKYFLLGFAFLASDVLLAQNIDSLKLLLKNAKEDTNKLNLLFDLADAIKDEKIWPGYNQQGLELAKKLAESDNVLISKKGKTGIAGGLNNIGFLYYQQGDIVKTLEAWNTSLKLFEELNEKVNVANLLTNTAALYDNQGNVPKALEYCERALRIQEQFNNKAGMALSLNTIGYIYNKQGDIQNSLKYWLRSLQLQREIRNNQGIAIMLNNIASIYYVQGKPELALDYYRKSLDLHQKYGKKMDVANALHNIGTMYSKAGNIEEGLNYYFQALTVHKEISNKQGCCDADIGISTIFLKQKKYRPASLYADSALTLAKELGFPVLLLKTEKVLTIIDSATGNFARAFEHYKQFITYRDSANNEKTRKASIKNQLNYEFEKREAVIKEQQEKERAVAEEKNRFQKIVIWSVVGGLLLVMIFAAFIFRSLKITKVQKLIIEEKQKEILDSIHYAKRIQISLLPSEKYITRHLSRSDE